MRISWGGGGARPITFYSNYMYIKRHSCAHLRVAGKRKEVVNTSRRPRDFTGFYLRYTLSGGLKCIGTSFPDVRFTPGPGEKSGISQSSRRGKVFKNVGHNQILT